MRRRFAGWACAALFGCSPGAPLHVHTAALGLRPSTPESDELFRFDDDELIESFDGIRVRVHYTRTGRNAVPSRDMDGSGVPDYVELVAERYDAYLHAYLDLGYRPPLTDSEIQDDNGGDGRFDIYLIDFFGSSDGSFQRDLCEAGTCIGYVVQENDFAGYGYFSLEQAARILATHELFHAIQASYDDGQDVIFSEGTAVWATELLEPELDDFERSIGAYLASPERPLNRPRSGVVLDPFAYGSALFFQFLSERFEDPDLIRRLLERIVDGANGNDDPLWYEALDELLQQELGSSLPEAFEEFAVWNASTGERAAGGAVSYARAARYPSVATDQMELPFTLERGRQPQLSAHYFDVFSGGRTTLEARLLGDAQGLSLWWMRGTGEEPRLVSGRSSASIALQPNETPLLIVINSNPEGPSRRGSLCVGSPSEVDACAEGLSSQPGPGAPDQTPDDGGSGDTDSDAGNSEAAGAEEPRGCTTGGIAFEPWLLLLGKRRFRRR